MISKIISGIFNLVMGLVSLLLAPIDNLIDSALPSISSALNMVSAVVDWICNLVPWGMSYMGLTSTTISLLVSFFIFKFTVRPVVHLIKTALAWYNKLKV